MRRSSIKHQAYRETDNIHFFLCLTDHAPRYNRAKKIQLDAQLFLSIFRQPLYVSGVSRSIIRRYNRMYTTVGTYYSFLMTVCCAGWIVPIQPGQQTVM